MTRIYGGGLCVVLVCCIHLLFGGEKPGSASTSSELTAILSAEAQTPAEATDRRTLLESARTGQDSSAAWWQSGYVRRGNAWTSFEESRPESAKAWQKYQVRRSAAQGTMADQLKLAEWCKEAGLRDQERVHLVQALQTGQVSNPTGILRRLGYRPVGSQWYTDAELKATAEELKKIGKEWKRVAPRLNDLALRLEGKAERREKALAELRSLTNRNTTPVLEFALATRSSAAATAVVDVLSEIDSYRASQSLARLALGSPWDSVRESATEKLKERPWEDFVPLVLGMMSLPISASVEAAPSSNDGPLTGRMVWRFLWSREGKTAVEVASSILIDDRRTTTTDRSLGVPELMREIESRAALESLFIGDLVYRHFTAAEDLEDRVQEFNHSIAEMLTAVTDQKLGDDPVSWWNWWDRDVTDTIPGPKTTFVVSEQVQSVGAPHYYPHSCLAAGTPVWTETGLQPIEKINIGDRVLSKNIETGELRYSPVLQTTRRENVTLTNIRVGEETIVASAGHNFWVSGRGWTRTNQLQPGMTAHTATGTIRFHVEDAGRKADVFNLMVADLHTYFVGKSLLLGHDVLVPAPSDIVVPGLPPALGAAK